MALPVYTDPNAGGVYDPEGDDIQQAVLSEALRRQKLRQQQAQAGAYQPMGGQMVGTPRYQHYVPDYGAGFRSAANIMGANSEMQGAQGAFEKQAQARAKRTQDEFEMWKMDQRRKAAVTHPVAAAPAAALPQTMDSLGGTPSPKSAGAGFQQVGYEQPADEEAALPLSTTLGVSEAMDDSEENGDTEPDDDFDDTGDGELDSTFDTTDGEEGGASDPTTAEAEEETAGAREAPAEIESTSLGQNVNPEEPSMLRAAFEQMATKDTVTPGGTPLNAGAGANDDRATWLLEGMQKFPKLRQALGHQYNQESAGNKKRAPINLGQGILYDPNTGQYLASGEYKDRLAGKSSLKREEQYLQFLNQRDLELLRQQGKGKTFEERAKFEALRAKIARERMISQEKIANIKGSAKTKSALAIAGAIQGNKLPADVRKNVMQERLGYARAEEALRALEKYPDAVGFKGMAPQAALNRMDPKGVAARAAITNLGSAILHDRSGAAVTAAEFPRLQPFIPSMEDSYETVKVKLRALMYISKKNEQMWSSVATESFSPEHAGSTFVDDLLDRDPSDPIFQGGGGNSKSAPPPGSSSAPAGKKRIKVDNQGNIIE